MVNMKIQLIIYAQYVMLVVLLALMLPLLNAILVMLLITFREIPV